MLCPMSASVDRFELMLMSTEWYDDSLDEHEDGEKECMAPSYAGSEVSSSFIIDGGDCHPSSYGEWPPGESMSGADGEERMGSVMFGVAGEALEDDETLSVLRLAKYPLESVERLRARAFRDSGLKRVILLYLFLADRPVRPGKYVFTIFVQTFPCSSTALRSISSASGVHVVLSIFGLSVSVQRLAH